MTKLYLFVMDECRPCYMVKQQLKRVEGWEKYVTLVTVTEDNKESIHKEHNIVQTPTLLGVKPDGEKMKFSAPSKMTKSFWEKLFTKINEELCQSKE